MVRCMRRRWFLATAEACREMPVEAASETIATSFLPCRTGGGGGDRQGRAGQGWQFSMREEAHACVLQWQ